MEIRLTAIAEEKIRVEMDRLSEKLWLRIYVSAAACHGAKFGMAFDDIKDGDEITNINGIDIITDTEFVPKYCDGLSVDYVTEPNEGFIIKSLRSVETKGCGGCGGGGNCSCKH
jgi:Fe-S cluster assembly iron-binding protein IscA